MELAPGSLIELNVPVYGLIDAPLEWHKTVTEELIKLNMEAQFRRIINNSTQLIY